MNDDNFVSQNRSTGRKYQVLALLAVGAVCFLAGGKMNEAASQREGTFLTADLEAVELRWRDIDIDRVNRKIEFVWSQLEERTRFTGEINKENTQEKFQRVLQLVGKGDVYNQQIFDIAWNQFDYNGNGTLNKDEFKALVDFIVEKANQFNGDVNSELESM